MGDLKSNIIISTTIDTNLKSNKNIELVYVVSGKAQIMIDENMFHVSKGNYFIIDFDLPHKYIEQYTEDFQIISCSFTPELLDNSLYTAKNFTDLAHSYLIRFNYRIVNNLSSYKIFSDDESTIFELFNKALQEYTNKKSGYIEFIRCFLLEIILTIMRSLISYDNYNLYNQYIRYINDYVDVNYMKPLTLSEFSSKLNYSLPYLSDKFKKVTGISFKQFLQIKRIEQGCKLLLTTNKKIPEIAELIGYNDTKFFNEVFKKHMKMTPREYKKLYK